MELHQIIGTYFPILLFVQGSSAKFTPLVIFKRFQRNMTVYKFELGNGTNVGPEWQLVNGLNKEEGEVTYVNVETQPTLTKRELIICELVYMTWTLDLIVTDTITSDKCKKMRLRGKPDDSTAILLTAEEKGRFFAPRLAGGKEYIKVMVDQCYNNGVLATRLTEGTRRCPSGSSRTGGEAMMVKRYKGIACQPPPANDSLTKFVPSRWVDMVYPTVLQVICAPWYKDKGGPYRCELGIWNRPFQNCSVVFTARKNIIVALTISLSILLIAACTGVIVYRFTKKSGNHQCEQNSEPCSPNYVEPSIYEEIMDVNIYEHLKPQPPERRRPANSDSEEKNTYQSLDTSKQQDGCL